MARSSPAAVGRCAMAPALALTRRRSIGVAALCLVLVGLGGCIAAPPGAVPASLLSYDRTFAAAAGAMADQKMILDLSDRRHGKVLATLDGIRITATVQPHFDGTNQVTFKEQGETQAGTALLKRVVDAYNERMRQMTMLPKGVL